MKRLFTARNVIRGVGIVALALAVAALAVPMLPAGVFRGRVEAKLEASLNREVDIGDVHFSFFPSGFLPRPGFALEGVTIHEDPRAGIEPFAYMDRMGASFRILSLLAGRVEIASLDFGDASVNLVKTRPGLWNFQLLGTGAQLLGSEAGGAPQQRMPSIRLRNGRVNFKFADTKSPFYFNAADFDISPRPGGPVEFRFGGDPSRSDATTQGFGRFFVRGSFTPAGADTQGSALAADQLDLRVELEQSSLEGSLRLIDPQGFGLHGLVTLDARLTGEPSQLAIEGELEVSDIHRWDLLPTEGGGWGLSYTGSLDLSAEQLEIASLGARVPEDPSPERAAGTKGKPGTGRFASPAAELDAPPVAVRFRAWDFLKAPKWEAGADLREVPLATLFEVGRHMGAELPEDLMAEGSISGSVDFQRASGFRGQVTLADAIIAVPSAGEGAEPLRVPAAELRITRDAIELAPATVQIGEQMAEVQGMLDLETRDPDLRIETAGLNVAAMRSFGLAAIPVIEQTPRGIWSGSARYQMGTWTSDSQLRAASLRVEGLAEPLEIASARVRLRPVGSGAAPTRIDRMEANVGGIGFTGSYEWRPGAERPHQFSIRIAEADGGAMRELLGPAISRDPGFLRNLGIEALGIGSAPAPPGWLRGRHASGSIVIDTVTVSGPVIGEREIRDVKASVLWDGTKVRLEGFSGVAAPATFSGQLTVDLTGPQPRFHYDGEVMGIAYKGGVVDVFGILDAEGMGDRFYQSVRVGASLTGRNLAVSEEAAFERVDACLEVNPASASVPRWRLWNLDAVQDGRRMEGTGASDAGGQLVLQLEDDGNQVQYRGTMFALGLRGQ